MTIFVFVGVENIVDKGENAGSLNVFKSLFTQGREKAGLCGKELILHQAIHCPGNHKWKGF